MYFKQIELNGFKSFADRTTIRLEPGITAIVGPNGCGKSNILDSLRWALGEQSPKTLRGTHMQDVIFNGSENRQPMGMAEVSVTFDNADSKLPVDFAEVQATRRLYRSGESEYLINKAPCRLRDIQELFMDTGIGTNAYSLIGQGKVDLVLSSKPEDRRFLFEEAAGIIKYKSRKKVAMRKLETAEQNLLRLNDIITEVQRQMRSLKRQVNAAIRYRELTDALRDLEVRSFYVKYARLSLEVTELRAQFTEAQNSYEQTMTGLTELEARNEDLAMRGIVVQRELAERREAVHNIENEMEKIERQIALMRQQLDFSSEQQEQLLLERDELRERANAIQKQIGQTTDSAEGVRKELSALRDGLEAKQAECDEAATRLSESESRLEATRAHQIEAMNSRAKAQTELETTGVSIHRIDEQLEAIYARQQVLQGRAEEVTARLNELRGGESETQASLTSTVAERRKNVEAHGAKTQEVRELNDEWQSLRERKSSQEARLHSLRELRDSYEGFATGVRAVMMAKQRNMPEAKGVIGPVGDLLSTEKTYERAVEAALGGNVNNVVVEYAEAAKGAIAFLKEHKAGRVTFLPLDTIRASQNDDYDAVRGLKGVIGPAIDYVQFETHIRKAAEYLLFNTVMVETIDDAIRIARTERRYPKLVTLDGEVVSSSGAVTGGRTQHEGRGLLGRSAEIAELEETVKNAENRVNSLLSRIQALAVEINDLSQRVKDFEKQENALRGKLNELGVQIARFSTEDDSNSQSAAQLTSQREALESERAKLEAQRADAQQRAETMEQDDVTLQASLNDAQDASAAARRELTARSEELSELRVALAALTQRLDEAERNRLREYQEYEDAVRNSERRNEQAVQLKENEANIKEEIAKNIDRAKELSDARETASKEAIDTQNSQKTLLDETEEISKTLREMHDRSRGSQADVHRLEITLRHDEDLVKNLEERILAEYRIALSSLDPEKVGTDELDEETRERTVEDLREKLERLGTVNLMAIEEYEALEKRNEFLVTQEEDLRKAREALLGVVTRIDLTIKQMFLDTFNKVSETFKVFFRRLFNGGQARIYLLDEDDPLECGIEIEARPPGKKPQGISLLSGGEQAMTAISLLFAIFKARPSPFCVLDEVDAPLDDANVDRFLTMVHEFTDESQFIIITHSKLTMSRANALYGITMRERGVSQVVSVRFDDKTTPEKVAESVAK
jgi:chromosome segregation protein